jgi:hypothetical protein
MLNVVFYNTSTLQKEEAHLETMFDSSGIMRGTSMISWKSSLPNLIKAEGMFQFSRNLTSFSGDLSALQDATSMFIEVPLISINTKLSSLEIGNHMFLNSTKLEKFDIELPRLSDGTSMFHGCTSLTSFTSALPSLTNGTNMFDSCKLDARSLMYIAETLPTVETPANITIGLGVNSEDEMEEFAKAASFNSWDELKQLFIDKNWTATFQYNGVPATAATLDENGQTTGMTIYARLLEADENSGEYISEEDGKYYNMEWGHSVTNTANYTLFGSLLEAYGYFGVVPKEFASE